MMESHILLAVVDLQILRPSMWHLRSGSIQLHLNIESKQKEMGRKTKLHDWEGNHLYTKKRDIIELLQSCLPYQSEARERVELDGSQSKVSGCRKHSWKLLLVS